MYGYQDERWCMYMFGVRVLNFPARCQIRIVNYIYPVLDTLSLLL